MGVVNVLIIFVVMFMNGLEYFNDLYFWIIGDGVILLVCISIFFLLIIIILDMLWYGIIWIIRLN